MNSRVCTLAAVLITSALAPAQQIEVISWTRDARVDGVLLEPGTRQTLREGMMLETDVEGNLFARYPDGSEVRFKEGTVARIGTVTPAGEAIYRDLELSSGTVEYLPAPEATARLRVGTVRGFIFTTHSDVSVRVDVYEGERALSCVVVHNMDGTTLVRKTPDTRLSVLKETVVTSEFEARMEPGSVLLLCPDERRTLEDPAYWAIQISKDAVEVIPVQESSPFRTVFIFDF